MVGIIAGQPLDTLRVRLQQQGCQQSSAAALWKAMGATEGSRGLVRGLTYPLSTIALQVRAERQSNSVLGTSWGGHQAAVGCSCERQCHPWCVVTTATPPSVPAAARALPRVVLPPECGVLSGAGRSCPAVVRRQQQQNPVVLAAHLPVGLVCRCVCARGVVAAGPRVSRLVLLCSER
jgi:hypothetical protein